VTSPAATPPPPPRRPRTRFAAACLLVIAAASVTPPRPAAAQADDPVPRDRPAPPNFSASPRSVPPAVPAPAAVREMPAPGLQVGNPADQQGFVYEKRRIKRTVPLDTALAPDGRWDLLYRIGGPGGEQQAVYVDWDDAYVYLGAETTAGPGPVRFDIDGRGDGWFRGVDNLSIVVGPPAADGGAPSVQARRWDTVQNRDRPVWAASPIAVGEMKAVAGRTPAGAYAVLLAVPRTEVIGLSRKPAEEWGLRVDVGVAALSVPEAALRPLLRLVLAEEVSADAAGGLTVGVTVRPRRIVPGEEIRIVLEARNEGAAPVRVTRLFVRGSQAAQPLFDAATFTGQVLAPGERVRREFRSRISPSAGIGTLVVTGGAEREDGAPALAALASLDRLDPFTVALDLDKRPVVAAGGAPSSGPQKRTAVVAVSRRGHGRDQASVALTLPPGWRVENDDERRDVSLAFAGQIQPVYFKIVVPGDAAPGVYPVSARVDVAGRSYTTGGTVTVTRAAAAAR
jgi:hypothetical protein